MHRALDILIPRFVTEDTAFYDDGNGDCYPQFCMSDFDPHWDVPPDYVAKVRHFNLFGFALFCRLDSDPQPYEEWRKSESA